MTFDRYSKIRKNGEVNKLPFLTINERSTDYYVTFDKDHSRLDNISYDYYGDPGYDWLILMANTKIEGLEFDIPDGFTLRIPFPLDAVLEEYNSKIDMYTVLYGLN